MKFSLITTTLNESKSILRFLKSIKDQSILPDEVIIIDGGSKDNTIEIINEFKNNNKKLDIKVKIIKGNISKGRNEAIKIAKNNVILVTDADCILEKKWIEKISNPFKDKKIDVVSGFYKPLSKNIFQKSLGTYTSVMLDKLDPENYLPSSRSIAFKKSAWKKAGMYPEEIDRGEDLYFAKKLKDKKLIFKFVKEAIVSWPQRNNIYEAFKQFFGYARGDGSAMNIRTNVLLLYFRYFLALYLLFISIIEKSKYLFIFILISPIFYIVWAIRKNYNYIKNYKALFYLPLLQFTADFAIFFGTILGISSRIKIRKNIENHKFLIFICFIYGTLVSSTLRFGIPNMRHPYPYHMDEWHQLSAVADTFIHGTPNMFGSANGTMLNFLISGFYIAPFALIKIVDPFSLQVQNLVNRENIFILLRFQSIIYGILSILVVYKISGLLNISKKISIVIFTFSPLFLMLSGYFKYDIALLFFIVLSVLSILIYSNNPTGKKFIYLAIPIGLSFAIKVSAIPLILIYAVSYFWFSKSKIKEIKYFFIGIIVLIAILFLFGMPDTLFGNGNIKLFLFENIIQSPSSTSNFNLNSNSYVYLLTRHYPIIFGHLLIYFSSIASFYLFILYLKKFAKRDFGEIKINSFLLFSFVIFVVSLLPLQIFASTNRGLVLLPFMALISTIFLKEIYKKKRIMFAILVFLVISFQIIESLLWIDAKNERSPQEVSSEWIQKNIPEGSLIGLENIPIYQGIPDVLQKEYYFRKSNVNYNYKYKYQIVDENSSGYPEYIVITDDDIDPDFYMRTPKRDIKNRLESLGYKRIAVFYSKKPYEMNNKDFHLASLITVPFNISVYKK